MALQIRHQNWGYLLPLPAVLEAWSPVTRSRDPTALHQGRREEEAGSRANPVHTPGLMLSLKRYFSLCLLLLRGWLSAVGQASLVFLGPAQPLPPGLVSLAFSAWPPA